MDASLTQSGESLGLFHARLAAPSASLYAKPRRLRAVREKASSPWRSGNNGLGHSLSASKRRPLEEVEPHYQGYTGHVLPIATWPKPPTQPTSCPHQTHTFFILLPRLFKQGKRRQEPAEE